MQNLQVIEANDALIAALERKKPSLWQGIFTWAESHPPRYPWRRLEDPYRVLIGELLLENVRSAPVAASERFLNVFPSVDLLLAADKGIVNGVLERLHLQRNRDAILRLVGDLAMYGIGGLPCDSETLSRISGLGRHHIRAVFCFGYGLPIAVVNEYVRRMLKRLFTNSLPHNPSTGLVETIAESLVSYRDPQTYNGVLLDLAELVCLPEAPSCRLCPVISICDIAPGLQILDKTSGSTIESGAC